jgi:hypothetical protein
VKPLRNTMPIETRHFTREIPQQKLATEIFL